MLMVISPAKTLDFDTPAVISRSTRAGFLDDSALLIDALRELAPADISHLMGISDKLAQLNAARYMSWRLPFSKRNAKQAALAFRGDVYTGLDADSFSAEDFAFAQQHLRILSGLYGLLRPLDLIQPYRLEMGTRFVNSRGANLYAFWNNKITEALNRQIAKNGDKVLLNLASNEYFKAVKVGTLTADVITPVFKDKKAGKYKIVSFYAKKARGLMAAYVIKQRIKSAEALKQFNVDGYQYNEKQSTAQDWVFTRDGPPSK